MCMGGVKWADSEMAVCSQEEARHVGEHLVRQEKKRVAVCHGGEGGLDFSERSGRVFTSNKMRRTQDGFWSLFIHGKRHEVSVSGRFLWLVYSRAQF